MLLLRQSTGLVASILYGFSCCLRVKARISNFQNLVSHVLSSLIIKDIFHGLKHIHFGVQHSSMDWYVYLFVLLERDREQKVDIRKEKKVVNS